MPLESSELSGTTASPSNALVGSQGVSEGRAILDKAISERDFQDQVIRLARLRGYCVYHTYDSRRSARGFPDLCMFRWLGDGTVRLIYAEIKTMTGRVSLEQCSWLAGLGAVPGIGVYLWRPSDWDEIENVLS